MFDGQTTGSVFLLRGFFPKVIAGHPNDEDRDQSEWEATPESCETGRNTVRKTENKGCEQDSGQEPEDLFYASWKH